MSITVVCPSCQSKVRAPDKLAGKRVKCPKCGTALDVPTPAPDWVAEQMPVATPPRHDYGESEPVASSPPPPSYPQIRRELAWITFPQQVRSVCDSVGFGPDLGKRLVVVVAAAAALFAVSMLASFFLHATGGVAVGQAAGVAVLALLVGSILLLFRGDRQLEARRGYLLLHLPGAKNAWEANKAKTAEAAADPVTEVQPYRPAGAAPVGVEVTGPSLVPTSGVAYPVGATKACPFCGEVVLAVAKKCKHCGETIDVALAPRKKPSARPAKREGPPNARGGRAGPRPPTQPSSTSTTIAHSITACTSF